MAETAGIIIALGAVAIMLLIIFVKSNLIICQPNEVIIISGKKRKLADGTVVGYRVLRGGRGFRIPLVESISRMSLNTMPIDISLSKALSKGIIPINVRGLATVKIAGSEAEGVSNAIERFLGKNPNDVAAVARETIEGSLRGVLATLAPEEANSHRLSLAEKASEAAGKDLRKLGLVLDTLQIQHISDDQGYLEAIGRKRNAEVAKNARIAEANAEAEARRVSAEAKRAGSVAESEAEKAILAAENELRLERARLDAESNKAEERAAVAREIARVEEQRTLEEARVEMNQKKYNAEVVVPARAEKEAEELKAKGQAARILEDGKATADALAKLRTEWADGGSKDLMLLQMLPELLERITGVLSDNLNIERLTVIDSGDGGLPNHVRGITGSIVAVLEQLKNATGLDVSKILQANGAAGAERHIAKEL